MRKVGRRFATGKAVWGSARRGWHEPPGETRRERDRREGGHGGFKCRRVSTSLWDRTQDSPTLSASLSRIEARLRPSTSSVLSPSPSLAPSLPTPPPSHVSPSHRQGCLSSSPFSFPRSPSLSSSLIISLSRFPSLSFSLFLSLSLSAAATQLEAARGYIYIYICVCVCVYIYIRSRAYVRTRTVRVCRHREWEKSLFPSHRAHRHTGRCRRKENGHADRRGDDERDPAAKFAVSFRQDLSVPLRPLSLSLFLSLSLCLSFSLRRSRERTTTRPLAYVRTCRAGRNQPPGKPHSASDSRHFAVPLAPDDTRKPMESANTTPTSGPWKRIRETPGKSHGTSLARSPGPWSRTPAAGIQPPIRTSAPHRPRVLAVTSECWKLRRLVAITARIAIGRRPVRPFARD